jgi:hypothetical protein
VKEVLPEAKLLLKRGEGTKVALAKHCHPAKTEPRYVHPPAFTSA